ncbi:hypothetical protein [Ligilactobacillus pobuzihii]|uniref:Uncharacterized protein n=1 Tax=Ligilactobacillus pobuzihii TaxID=449659 RepID=A0A0R2LPZ8_9LACO|nr:hypothetical protein [Ligilactobacillus pobuzihii]KRK09134.1 hypothetical protein FD11_GL001327 [Ligilactobacillus pobuzihii E100301 = KCTC 13174]KRO01648.1 hypothetical protein IV66_GL002162 [Ligilactobacillus pobuzihii]GEN48388.1 hypothetical protein LPO01_11800 [Ligilactobacillus pobuzihii]
MIVNKQIKDFFGRNKTKIIITFAFFIIAMALLTVIKMNSLATFLLSVGGSLFIFLLLHFYFFGKKQRWIITIGLILISYLVIGLTAFYSNFWTLFLLSLDTMFMSAVLVEWSIFISDYLLAKLDKYKSGRKRNELTKNFPAFLINHKWQNGIYAPLKYLDDKHKFDNVKSGFDPENTNEYEFYLSILQVFKSLELKDLEKLKLYLSLNNGKKAIESGQIFEWFFKFILPSLSGLAPIVSKFKVNFSWFSNNSVDSYFLFLIMYFIVISFISTILYLRQIRKDKTEKEVIITIIDKIITHKEYS